MRTDTANEFRGGAPDTCVITSYFNPCGYVTKYNNFRVFQESLARQGAPLYVIELAATENANPLPIQENLVRVTSSSKLWHKERLLNMLIKQLPACFTKVCWVDCDVIFDNPGWLQEASEALTHFEVVQLFDSAIRMPRGQITYSGGGIEYRGFSAVAHTEPAEAWSGWFVRHGHTGFAWAGRRSWLERHGLYDACMSGSGDHLMAHAFLGDIDCRCVNRIVGSDTPYRAHYDRWANSVTTALRGSLGYVGGLVRHLWHGDVEDRRYPERDKELIDYGYDPELDLRTAPTGCLEWTERKAELHVWGHRYFHERKEDEEANGGEMTNIAAENRHAELVRSPE